jgi:hypothetical protein
MDGERLGQWIRRIVNDCFTSGHDGRIVNERYRNIVQCGCPVLSDSIVKSLLAPDAEIVAVARTAQKIVDRGREG